MGVAVGAIALDSDAVKRLSEAGTPAIIVRRDTVTTDIEGMALARDPHRIRRAHVPRGGGGAPTRQSVPRRLPGTGN